MEEIEKKLIEFIKSEYRKTYKDDSEEISYFAKLFTLRYSFSINIFLLKDGKYFKLRQMKVCGGLENTAEEFVDFYIEEVDEDGNDIGNDNIALTWNELPEHVQNLVMFEVKNKEMTDNLALTPEQEDLVEDFFELIKKMEKNNIQIIHCEDEIGFINSSTYQVQSSEIENREDGYDIEVTECFQMFDSPFSIACDGERYFACKR